MLWLQVQYNRAYDIKTSSGNYKRTADTAVMANPGFFYLKLSGKTETPSHEPENAEVKIKVQNKDFIASFLIDVQHPHFDQIFENPAKNTFKIDFATTKDIKNLDTTLTVELPNPNYESFTFLIKREHSTTRDGTKRATDVSAKLNDKEIKVETQLLRSGTETDLTATLKISGDTTKKFHLNYDTSDTVNLQF